jgi:glycosyltransferase involved in cell wall biosynthesis
MTITVVVPVYGESEWLVEALTSVVEQTSSEWKLLIADDGLYKKTAVMVKAMDDYSEQSKHHME